MAISFANAITRDWGGWALLATIEGIGGYTEGIWKICTEVPTYASGSAEYKDWLTEYPDHLGERADPFGGVVELGDCSLSILDESDSFTGQLKIFADAETMLDGSINSSTTTVDVKDASNLTAGTSVIFVGSEAMTVDGISSNQLTVTRGALGTDGTAHDDLDLVFTGLPYLRSRRVRLYLTPIDGSSSSDETEIGTYYLSNATLTSAFNVWTISAKSQLHYLARTVPLDPRGGEIITVFNEIQVNGHPVQERKLPAAHWPSEDIYLDIEGEVVRTGANTGRTMISINTIRNGRAQLGTAQRDWEEGDQFHQVMVADTQGACSFRWSPATGGGPSEDRSSGTWNKSCHWVDILLCILTSSAHSDDALELVNYDGTYGNWSSLPVGYGAGVPQSLIDWTTFLDAKDRTPAWLFPWFYYGQEPRSFADIADEFLRLAGAFMTARSGKVALVLPEPLLDAAAATSVTEDELLRVETDEGVYSLDLEHSLDVGSQYSAVSVNMRGPRGQRVSLRVTNEDIGAIYGQRGYYGVSERPREIDAPSLRPDGAGSDPLAERVAQRFLYKSRFPPHRLRFRTHLGLWDEDIGELMDVTQVELPALASGARDWSSVLFVPHEREIASGPDQGGVTMRWAGHAFETTRFGRISASAHVASVVSNTATCTANRYTDATVGGNTGLPVQDAAAFVAGDVVRLVDLDGTDVGGGTQTVNSTSGNDVELDGNFSGNLAADTFLVYAYASESASQQTDEYVYYADTTAHDVGSAVQVAWRYSEP